MPNKQRYITLDAMRGVAALVVVARHFSDQRGIPAPHFSYLAVDLFFLLSGFVISLSYDDRFSQGMTIVRFLKIRILRLYPIYVIGLAISLVWLVLLIGKDKIGFVNALIIFLSSSLMLPSPTSGWSLATFPSIGAAWSLFFEFYVANVIYALIARRMTISGYAIIVLISLILLVASVVYFGDLNLGSQWDNFVGGAPRVLFSFFAGVLLRRIQQKFHCPIKVRSEFTLIALSLILIMPNWVPEKTYDLLCVIFVFPSLIYVGSEAIERITHVGAALGDASYAIYVIHSPIIGIWSLYDVGTGRLKEGLFLIAVAACGLLLHYIYDQPVRRRLRQALKI